MACENDKCEKYGMHHDYENGVEIRKCQFCINDQPDSSKREDSVYGSDAVLVEAEKQLRRLARLAEMRYSEHNRNVVREVQ